MTILPINEIHTEVEETTTTTVNEGLGLITALSAVPGAVLDRDFEADKTVIDLSAVDMNADIGNILIALREKGAYSVPAIIVIPEGDQHSFRLFGLIQDYSPVLEARYNVAAVVEDVDIMTKGKERIFNIAVKKAYNKPLTLRERIIDFTSRFNKRK